MSVVIDGTSGLTTPGVVNTAGETIATTLAVTGASTLTGAVTASTTLAVTGASTLTGQVTATNGMAVAAGLATGTGIGASGAGGDLRLYANGIQSATITAAGLLQFNSGYGSAATAYGCRAWVNFNGTGTVAIRASGNVSSITDNAAGNYTVNFTTAMVDTSYSVIGTCKYVAAFTGQNVRVGTQAYTSVVLVGSVIVNVTTAGNGTEGDSEMVNISIFR